MHICNCFLFGLKCQLYFTAHVIAPLGGATYSLIVGNIGNETGKPSSIFSLDSFVFLYCIYALDKGMNPSVLSPAMSKKVG